ncbi:MAG: hypothetical protein ACLQNE_17365 [Thermoguttaceae bacterium]|jgi:uncharacterized protein YbaR (Trm112 family)
MLDPNLLKLLLCPESRTPLAEVDDATLAQLNHAIRAGTLKNKVGRKLESALDGGLIRKDGAVVYPILDGIPVLLMDEGIPMDQLQ